MPFASTLAKLGSDQRLARLSRPLHAAGTSLERGGAGPALRGDWLGHALHPMLTDIPIGCWTSSFILDLAGGRGARVSSQRLIAVGLLSVVPTAAAGMVDYASIDEPSRRNVGAAHALANGTATALYFLSWRARRRDHHVMGVVLGLVGAAAASAAGYLGGHLVFGADSAAE